MHSREAEPRAAVSLPQLHKLLSLPFFFVFSSLCIRGKKKNVAFIQKKKGNIYSTFDQSSTLRVTEVLCSPSSSFFFFLLPAPTVLMIYDRNFLELVQWQERSWLVYINPSDLCSHVLNYRLMETCCGLLLPIEIRSPPQPGVILIHIQHPGSRSISIDLQ